MPDAEYFGSLREASKLKRASNRRRSTELLTQKGYEFESKNNGAHLIVTGYRGYVDFWPGTGKFIARNGVKGRGVHRMISLIQGGKI